MKSTSLLAAGAFALIATPTAFAQAPVGLSPGAVRITSTLPTGSGPDTVARVIAEKLQTRWGRPVVVEAKPGAPAWWRSMP